MSRSLSLLAGSFGTLDKGPTAARRAFTDRLSGRAKLLREIDTARRKHLAFDPAEHGIGAVGVTVLDPFGRPVAVLIPALDHRSNEQREMLSLALLAFLEKLRIFVGRQWPSG